MDPLKVAACFAAYVWFTKRPENVGKDRREAVRFARDNWIAFLPAAHEGVGRLLLTLATPSRSRPRRRARRRLTARADLDRMLSARITGQVTT